MMLFAEQRRKLALFICPEIARAIQSDERQMHELRKAAGYNGQSKPIARAQADMDDLDACSKRYGRSIRGIFAPTPEEREEFRSSLRNSRVERAKQVLQIGREIQLHGFVGDPELALNPLAERLADALFGRVGE